MRSPCLIGLAERCFSPFPLKKSKDSYILNEASASKFSLETYQGERSVKRKDASSCPCLLNAGANINGSCFALMMLWEHVLDRRKCLWKTAEINLCTLI